ncbi:hypothetical protein POM88_050285 [Heracleum sosnowskyi]|uniref:RNase H type-1 domain-containing protein n=1 Tax=Heracleum sosnowskyi TaxID=360622 RepID=A0AAD8GZH0_9APIA|nr:hypothetical protein POM88_050285 [Heracleum sosnowskyi]
MDAICSICGETDESITHCVFGCVAATAIWKHNDLVFKFVSAATAITLSSWQCPPVGYVKINTDAHVPFGSNVGLGVVIRNEMGKLLVAVKRCDAISPGIAGLISSSLWFTSGKKALLF